MLGPSVAEANDGLGYWLSETGGEYLLEDLRRPSVMIVINPSRKIRINDPTRATYSRLDLRKISRCL